MYFGTELLACYLQLPFRTTQFLLLVRLKPTAWKRLEVMYGQFLVPLMDGSIGNVELTSEGGYRLAAGLRKPYSFSLKLLRRGLFWHAFSSPFGIVYIRFHCSTDVGDVQIDEGKCFRPQAPLRCFFRACFHPVSRIWDPTGHGLWNFPDHSFCCRLNCNVTCLLVSWSHIVFIAITPVALQISLSVARRFLLLLQDNQFRCSYQKCTQQAFVERVAEVIQTGRSSALLCFWQSKSRPPSQKR